MIPIPYNPSPAYRQVTGQMKLAGSRLSTFRLADIGAAVQSLYLGTARHAVLDTVEFSLVLFDDRLVNTANGESRTLDLARQDVETRLAGAARQLVGSGRKNAAILLLLPPSWFVATHYNFRIQSEQMLRSSLQLQAHTLIPACDEELMLGLDGARSEGTALWFPRRKADRLFSAFKDAGLFLAALVPRSLVFFSGSEAQESILDEDASNLTHLVRHEGALVSVLNLARADLDQADFREQWEHEIGKSTAGTTRTINTLEHWSGLSKKVMPSGNCLFIPPAAIVRGRQIVGHKQRKAGAMLAALLVLVCALPFMANAARKFMLERELAQLQELSFEARASQAAVFDMEDAWGAVADYPRQDVAGVLLTLNTLIEDSLSTFSLNRGVIDITGFAQDPALLLDQLAQQEAFFEVSQSRSSSGGSSFVRGDRFGFRMNLSGVDFGTYDENHPAGGE
jgi:hypothetical protein